MSTSPPQTLAISRRMGGCRFFPLLPLAAACAARCAFLAVSYSSSCFSFQRVSSFLRKPAHSFAGRTIVPRSHS